MGELGEDDGGERMVDCEELRDDGGSRDKLLRNSVMSCKL